MAEYDPKHKKHSPLKSLLKVGAMILCVIGVIIAIRMQQGLIQNERAAEKEAKKEVADHQHVERVEEPQTALNIRPVTKPGENPASPKGPQPVITTDATDEFPDEEDEEIVVKPSPKSNFPFNTERPVIVMSLPHNAELAVARYFSCGGVPTAEIGNYWGYPEKVPFGRCFYQNMRNNHTINHGCGRYSVYNQLQITEPAKTKGPTKFEARCFDPVLYPHALEELYKVIPNAIIVTVQQDPEAWFNSLPKDLKAFWKKTCNPTHKDQFPSSAKSLEKYENFYHDYHMGLISFIQEHEGWEFYTINWLQDVDVTASRLQEKFNIPAQCWNSAIEAPLKTGVKLITQTPVPVQKRPNSIPYPILDVSFPKSGGFLAHQYFTCGLGGMKAASQWTTPSNSTVEHPTTDIPIGRCIEGNMKSGTSTNILKGCGRARFWGDIGYLRDKTNGGTCYYPNLDLKALENFATYYPNATIIHSIRPAMEWYESAAKNHNLPARWVAAQHCPGFPESATDPEQWESFYLHHVQRIRDFAAKHPSLTFLEIPMGLEGGKMLQDTFQFPDECWPRTMSVDE